MDWSSGRVTRADLKFLPCASSELALLRSKQSRFIVLDGLSKRDLPSASPSGLTWVFRTDAPCWSTKARRYVRNQDLPVDRAPQ